MSVPDNSFLAKYAGDGTNTKFEYTWPCTATDKLSVQIADSDGVITDVDTTDYTVYGVGDTSSANWYIIYPNSGSALASGYTLSITPNEDVEQVIDYSQQGNNDPSVYEESLDKLTVLVGQVYQAVNRSVKVATTSSTDPDDLLDGLYTNVASAAVSATAAAASETNAATSENNALNSANRAEAAAAGVNLPSIVIGDAGKTLQVKSDGSGFELSSSTLAALEASLAEKVAKATFPVCIQFACSDEETKLAVATGAITFRAPFAFTLTGVRASLTTAQTSGDILTFDINKNGASVLSTKLTIDNGEKTSTTAETLAVISDSEIADDAEITIDITGLGDGTATGLKICLLGTRVVS